MSWPRSFGLDDRVVTPSSRTGRHSSTAYFNCSTQGNCGNYRTLPGLQTPQFPSPPTRTPPQASGPLRETRGSRPRRVGPVRFRRSPTPGARRSGADWAGRPTDRRCRAAAGFPSLPGHGTVASSVRGARRTSSRRRRPASPCCTPPGGSSCCESGSTCGTAASLWKRWCKEG